MKFPPELADLNIISLPGWSSSVNHLICFVVNRGPHSAKVQGNNALHKRVCLHYIDLSRSLKQSTCPLFHFGTSWESLLNTIIPEVCSSSHRRSGKICMVLPSAPRPYTMGATSKLCIRLNSVILMYLKFPLKIINICKDYLITVSQMRKCLRDIDDLNLCTSIGLLLCADIPANSLRNFRPCSHSCNKLYFANKLK